jgi:hypothetical protein
MIWFSFSFFSGSWLLFLAISNKYKASTMHSRCALLLMITAKSFENDDTDVQPLPNRLSWLSEIFSDLESRWK